MRSPTMISLKKYYLYNLYIEKTYRATEWWRWWWRRCEWWREVLTGLDGRQRSGKPQKVVQVVLPQ